MIERGVRLLLKRERLARELSEYVDGYKAVPESEEEIAEAERHARTLMAAVPWE